MKKYMYVILIALCSFLHINSSCAFYRRAAQHYLPRMGVAVSSGLTGALCADAYIMTPRTNNQEEMARRSDKSWECVKGISGSVGAYCLWGLARIAGFRRLRAPGIKLEQLQIRFKVLREEKYHYPLCSKRDLQGVREELKSLRRELSPVETEFEVREDDKQDTCVWLRNQIDTLEEEVDETLNKIDGR